MKAEQLAVHSEEEKRTLRSSLVALKSAYEEKERERVSEMNAKRRMEAEWGKAKAAVDKAQTDLSLELARAKAIRSEGKKARKQILEAVGVLRDMVHVARAGNSDGDGDSDGPPGLGWLYYPSPAESHTIYQYHTPTHPLDPPRLPPLSLSPLPLYTSPP